MDPSLVPSEGVLAPFYDYLDRVMAHLEGASAPGVPSALAPEVAADENVVAAMGRLGAIAEGARAPGLLADEQAYQHHLVAVHAERLVHGALAPGEAAAQAREVARRRVALGRRYLAWLFGQLASAANP